MTAQHGVLGEKLPKQQRRYVQSSLWSGKLTDYYHPVDMAYAIDIREVSGCTCRRARRATRMLTQIYDRALAPVGLTASQFDLLTNLFGASLTDEGSLPIGTFAARMGMHPTTLTRDLKPLIAQGLVADTDDPRDGRVRAVLITREGRDSLRKAVPAWRRAQKHVESALGAEAAVALNSLLDVAAAKLTPSRRRASRSPKTRC